MHLIEKIMSTELVLVVAFQTNLPILLLTQTDERYVPKSAQMLRCLLT